MLDQFCAFTFDQLAVAPDGGFDGEKATHTLRGHPGSTLQHVAVAQVATAYFNTKGVERTGG